VLASEHPAVGLRRDLGARLRLRVVNAACPGETSSSFITPSAQSNGCENAVPPATIAYRRRFPLHVRYAGSQLAFAVRFLRRHPRTRLVSLMLGANDLFVCQKTTSDRCGSAAEQRATLVTLSRNVRRILATIRRKRRYRGRFALVSYYSPDYASAVATAVTVALNRTVERAARPYRVVVADGFAAFRAAAADFGGDTCAAGLLTRLGPAGSCGVHPSSAGQAVLAHALEKAIRRGRARRR
jgi:lysophospholipase L1-like esterase